MEDIDFHSVMIQMNKVMKMFLEIQTEIIILQSGIINIQLLKDPRDSKQDNK